ncbi:MAG: type I 3-dehydroquinate dehydratase [Kordiimonadaceae bacterium]|jgi:3-dehydroquinate dehydratase I|nr:type I 3-dehydroquinate dehydratase [Kordiimonadaceae bacterium]MBT6031771.1 type I 3-dehydroquinate dehydratase [Kordiimonadaceae bacterium]
MRVKNNFIKQVKHIKENAGVVVAVLVDDGFSKQEIERHIKCGMGVAEIRIDMFQSYAPNHIIKEIDKFAEVPTLATIRKTEDGGFWNKPETERIELFKSIIPHVWAVDIELSEPETLSALKEFLCDHSCDLVASYHNFDQTPNDDFLHTLISQAKKVGADAVKIACMVKSEADCIRLATLFEKDLDIPKIIIGMGALGMRTRVSFPALGSLLTYSPSDKISAAYGQISFSDMIEQLREFYPTFVRR